MVPALQFLGGIVKNADIIKFWKTAMSAFFKKKIENLKKQIFENDKTMEFCKKCHKRIARKFNGPPLGFQSSLKTCVCDSPPFTIKCRSGLKMVVIPAPGSLPEGW